jgi:catechol 2,3-dioxygenase-like lactoylglutathione lyase family enzyme
VGGRELKVTIQDVAVVSVPVADQERAKRFYVDTLGFELIEEVSAPDLHWIQVAPKGASTSLTLVDWFESMPAGSLNGLVLMSSNLRSDYEELVAKGVRFDGPPEPQPYAALETVLRDPDGNGLILQQA